MSSGPIIRDPKNYLDMIAKLKERHKDQQKAHQDRTDGASLNEQIDAVKKAMFDQMNKYPREEVDNNKIVEDPQREDVIKFKATVKQDLEASRVALEALASQKTSESSPESSLKGRISAPERQKGF